MYLAFFHTLKKNRYIHRINPSAPLEVAYLPSCALPSDPSPALPTLPCSRDLRTPRQPPAPLPQQPGGSPPRAPAPGFQRVCSLSSRRLSLPAWELPRPRGPDTGGPQ